MKTYALIAALALFLPGVANARKSHGHSGHSHHGHSHSGHYHGGHRHYGGHSHSYRGWRGYYPSFGYRSYGYYPYRSYYGGYYGGYGYPYYYGGYPSVSFTYSSASPRYYSSSRYSDYGSNTSSLEVEVQRELRRLGYYRGSIDGDIGPGSRSAIRAFQADRGLSVTGRIDASLLRSLGI